MCEIADRERVQQARGRDVPPICREPAFESCAFREIAHGDAEVDTREAEAELEFLDVGVGGEKVADGALV